MRQIHYIPHLVFFTFCPAFTGVWRKSDIRYSASPSPTAGPAVLALAVQEQVHDDAVRGASSVRGGAAAATARHRLGLGNPPGAHILRGGGDHALRQGTTGHRPRQATGEAHGA